MKPEDLRSGRSSDPAPDGTVAHPADAGDLWEQLLSRGNLAEALRRVEQNAGAPGIDGMSTKDLRPWLHDHWTEVRSALEAGTYRPQPVRRVMIPKPSGGMRKLGVPAAVDRSICRPSRRCSRLCSIRSSIPIASGFGRGARSIRVSSGHASSSLTARCGALILISNRSSIAFARRTDGQVR